MESKSPTEVIHEQAARLRAQRHQPILKVRMHPIDVAYLKGQTVTPGRPLDESMLRVLGIPVEEDFKVPVGEPEVEYAE